MTLGTSLGCGGCCKVPVTLRKVDGLTGKTVWKLFQVDGTQTFLPDDGEIVLSSGATIQRWAGEPDGVTRLPAQLWSMAAAGFNAVTRNPVSGNFWFACQSTPLIIDPGAFNVAEYDPDGNLLSTFLWWHAFPPNVGAVQFCFAIGATSDGDLIVSVYSEAYGGAVQRRTQSGTLVWEHAAVTALMAVSADDTIAYADVADLTLRDSGGSETWSVAHGAEVTALAFDSSGNVAAGNQRLNDLSLHLVPAYAMRVYAAADGSVLVASNLGDLTIHGAAVLALAWDDSDSTWIIGHAKGGDTYRLRKSAADLSATIWTNPMLHQPRRIVTEAGRVYVSSGDAGRD